MALQLSTTERQQLKARAHRLKPVVMIGADGLTEAVIAEADRALRAHELIKVRVAGDDREQRPAMMATLCERLDCAAVQSIGKLLVIWRPRPVEVETPPTRRAATARPASARPAKTAGSGQAPRKRSAAGAANRSLADSGKRPASASSRSRTGLADGKAPGRAASGRAGARAPAEGGGRFTRVASGAQPGSTLRTSGSRSAARPTTSKPRRTSRSK